MTKKKDPKDLLKRGRPNKYTKDVAALVCMRVATNPWGLSRLCSMYDDIPQKTTINEWRLQYPEFSVKYAQAKLKQAELLAEECIDIAFDNSQDKSYTPDGKECFNGEFVARSRLKVDTLKWMASKLLPRTYGKAAEEIKIDASESLLEKVLKNVK